MRGDVMGCSCCCCMAPAQAHCSADCAEEEQAVTVAGSGEVSRSSVVCTLSPSAGVAREATVKRGRRLSLQTRAEGSVEEEEGEEWTASVTVGSWMRALRPHVGIHWGMSLALSGRRGRASHHTCGWSGVEKEFTSGDSRPASVRGCVTITQLELLSRDLFERSVWGAHA